MSSGIKPRKKKLTNRLRIHLSLLLVCIALLTGCIAARSLQKPKELARPDPGYLHWLRKQSMLGQAAGYISQVSQSQRLWLQSGEPRRASVLLEAAPNWLEIQSIPASPPVFRELIRKIASVSSLGFGGLYLGETGEKPDLWGVSTSPSNRAKAASLEFDPAFGTEADFDRFAETAEAAHMEIGSDLLGVVTGRGPDFFLQARNAADHEGVYALLPVPESALPLLPEVRNEWDCVALEPETVAKLTVAGVLPAAIGRERLGWASFGGWAATGPVTGTDGLSRRWLYWYSLEPDLPILGLQDPSGHAYRILQGATIRHTGLLGQSLAGLHFEPAMALEPGNASSPPLSPGLSALNEIARQIHRYGGWVLQADPLPPDVIQEVLRGPCDFCRDDITPLLVYFGLLMADGRPLAQLYNEWIASGLDVSRLARGYNTADGLRPTLLTGEPKWQPQAQKLASLGPVITPAILAQNLAASNPDCEETLRRFLLVWRLGMPGLAFVESPPANELPDDPWLSHTLKARKNASLANGKIQTVIRGNGGGFGLLSRLPDGGYWLLACNFGRNRDELKITLPATIRSALDAGTTTSLNDKLSSQSFIIALDGREARNVVFSAAYVIPTSLNISRETP